MEPQAWQKKQRLLKGEHGKKNGCSEMATKHSGPNGSDCRMHAQAEQVISSQSSADISCVRLLRN